MLSWQALSSPPPPPPVGYFSAESALFTQSHARELDADAELVVMEEQHISTPFATLSM